MNRGTLAVIGCVVALAVIGVMVLLDDEASATDASKTGAAELTSTGDAGGAERNAMELERLATGEERRLDVVEPRPSDAAPDVFDAEDGVAAARLVGRVTLTGTGTPVAGLVLVPTLEQPAEVQGGEGKPLRSQPRQATTDESGRYSFTIRGAATLVSMAVLPGEDIPRQRIDLGLTLSPGAETIADFEVEGGVRVSGQVVDLDGRPVPGAAVHGWTGPRYLLSGQQLATPEQSTACDAGGAFTLGGVGPSWLLEASAEGFTAHQRVHGQHTAGDSVDGVVLVLSPVRRLSGRVLAAGARPLSGATIKATVTLRGASQTVTANEGVYITGPRAREATSDAQGRFEIDGLASRPYAISVRHPRFPEWTGEHAPGDGELLVQLESGLTLSGLVVSRDGRAVPGAKVRLRSTQMFGDQANSRSTESDESGRFVLEGLLPDSNGYLLVQAEGFAVHVDQPVVIEAAGQPDVTVVLSPPWRLAGRVIDNAGQPMASVSVEIEGDRLVDHGDVTMAPLPTWERSFGLSTRVTDALGQFRFDGLYDGLFRVEAGNDSGELRTVVEARSGNETLELVLDPEAIFGVTLAGEARDATTGLPVTEFSVTPMIPSGSGGMTGSGQHYETEQGSWRMVGLDAGPMKVTASAVGYAPWSIPLVDYIDGEHRIDIGFSPTRNVVFLVLDDDREPVALDLTFADEEGRSLMVESGSNSRGSRLKTDASGQGRAAGLPAQRITVTAKKGWLSTKRNYLVDLTHAPSGPVELIYGTTDEQTVMLIVLSGVPADPSVLEISDLASPIAARTLQDELNSGALRPLPVPVVIDAVDAGGVVVAGRSLDPADENPDGFTQPGISGAFMVTLTLPLREVELSASAPGFVGASRMWVPENAEGPAVVVLVLQEE